VQVVTQLGEVGALGGDLCYSTKQDQLELLKQVLSAGEEDCLEEQLEAVFISSPSLFLFALLTYCVTGCG
jgi:hypothetical protein